MSGRPALGLAPRRFLWRWNVRVLRVEWRQHAAIFVLIVLAVAISIAAVLATYHLVEPPENTYGNGEVIASVSGDPTIGERALTEQGLAFGMIRSADLGLPGTAARLEIKVQDPDNAVTGPLLDLVDGRWPSGLGEVAVTDRLVVDGPTQPATAIGDTVEIGGEPVEVVGIVENPTDLGDEFVLATDLDQFAIAPDDQATIFLIDAEPANVTFPAGIGRVTLATRDAVLSVRTALALAVNGVAAIAMVEVALLVGAGFAVLARRRTRQYGLLGAAGATPRQLRLAATAAGTIIGVSGSVVGLVVGVAIAAAIVPSLETTVGHRISLTVPWWTIVPTVVMATGAASIAAWWPARPLSTRPVAHLLGALRPQPSPTGRTTMLGAALAVTGAAAIIIGFAELQTAVAIIGIVLAPIGLLLLAPLLVELIGRWSASLPMAARLGGRAVARHNRRSAAVVAALAIALGIPTGATVVTRSIDGYEETRAPNLDERSAIAWIPGVEQSIPHIPAYLVADDQPPTDPAAGPAQRLAAAVPQARVVPIRVAISPDAEAGQENFDRIGSASAVVPHFAVEEGSDCFDCDIYAFGTVDENGDEILYVAAEAWIATPDLLAALDVEQPAVGTTALAREPGLQLASNRGITPAISNGIVHDEELPAATSVAPLLVDPATVAELGLDEVTVGWLLVADAALTADDRARIAAAAGDEAVAEFRVEPQPASAIRLIAVAAGLVTGLGIAVAAVGLFTAEAADDARILQSIGAAPATARRLSSAIATILAGAGAVIAVLVGYLAILPLLTIDDPTFPFVVPWISLAGFLLVFPLLAGAAGWLTAGRSGHDLTRPRS